MAFGSLGLSGSQVTTGGTGGSATVSIGGTVTSGTVGSILFIGTGPVLSQDNANLFWDDTNNRIGIHTTAPTADISFGANSQINTLAGFNLTIMSGTTGGIVIDTGTTGPLDIGNGSNSKSITIGNVTGTTGVTINSGTSGTLINTTGVAGITIANNGSTGVVDIASGSQSGINIASSSVAKAVLIGNTVGTSAILMRVGTGNFLLEGSGASTYTIGGSVTTGTITIGGTAQTGTITIGGGTAGQTVDIAAANGNNVLNLGTGTGAKFVNLGSTDTTSQTIISAGLNGITMSTGTTGPISIDTGTTGGIGMGTGAFAKTITLGNATGATALNINTGTAGSIVTSTVIGNDGVSIVTAVLTTGKALKLTGNPTNGASTGALLGLERTSAGRLIRTTDGTNVWTVESSTATPEASLTANPGSLTVDALNGAHYIKTTGTATNTGWGQVQANRSTTVAGPYTVLESDDLVDVSTGTYTIPSGRINPIIKFSTASLSATPPTIATAGADTIVDPSSFASVTSFSLPGSTGLGSTVTFQKVGSSWRYIA